MRLNQLITHKVIIFIYIHYSKQKTLTTDPKRKRKKIQIPFVFKSTFSSLIWLQNPNGISESESKSLIEEQKLKKKKDCNNWYQRLNQILSKKKKISQNSYTEVSQLIITQPNFIIITYRIIYIVYHLKHMFTLNKTETK